LALNKAKSERLSLSKNGNTTAISTPTTAASSNKNNKRQNNQLKAFDGWVHMTPLGLQEWQQQIQTIKIKIKNTYYPYDDADDDNYEEDKDSQPMDENHGDDMDEIDPIELGDLL